MLDLLDEAIGGWLPLTLRDRALLWLVRSYDLAALRQRALSLRKWAPAAAAAALALAVSTSAGPDETASLPVFAPAPEVLPAPREVWLAEKNGHVELYSNGLQISDEFLASGRPRSYRALPESAELDDEAAWRRAPVETKPAGLVYHATVSEVAPPFKAEHREGVTRHGRLLLRYAAERRLYNFIIDRFGRAFRLISEDQTAGHAGWSLWTGGGRRYFNLNDSFVGIACETRPEASDPEAPFEESVTQAQVATLKLLTEMLRNRYDIPAENCVPHEVVSVNPSNYLIGYHTDWAGRFPFSEVGLPDNYQLPPPSVADWGFEYDDLLAAKVGGKVWPGVARAEEIFRRKAAESGRSANERRRELRNVYRRLLKRLRQRPAS